MRSPLGLFAIAIVAALCTACTRADADVQQDLQQQLNSDSITAPAHLSVTVQQGVAHLLHQQVRFRCIDREVRREAQRIGSEIGRAHV